MHSNEDHPSMKKESSNENTMYSSPTFNTLRDSFKADDHYDAGYMA